MKTGYWTSLCGIVRTNGLEVWSGLCKYLYNCFLYFQSSCSNNAIAYMVATTLGSEWYSKFTSYFATFTFGSKHASMPTGYCDRQCMACSWCHRRQSCRKRRAGANWWLDIRSSLNSFCLLGISILNKRCRLVWGCAERRKWFLWPCWCCTRPLFLSVNQHIPKALNSMLTNRWGFMYTHMILSECFKYQI